MAQDEDIWKQLNGPIAQAIGKAIDTKLEPYYTEAAYMQALAINTANGDWLNTIGELVGVPWGIAPAGVFDANLFIFGKDETYPTISVDHGFAKVVNSIVTGPAGVLGTAQSLSSYRIPITSYRQLLVAVAKIKYQGLSLPLIADVCLIFCPNGGFTITWDSVMEIVITFTTTLATGNLWLVQYTFAKLTTLPAINIVNT
jgi:hypothetical protein